MSATTYLIRKEETSYNTTTRTRSVDETIIWEKDGSDFAISMLGYTGEGLTSTLDLSELETLAETEGLTDLDEIITDEKQRDNLDSTDYELSISY